MTATETTTPTFAAGDRFTYTGDPSSEALTHTIRPGATGTLDRRYGAGRWIATFDEGENYIGSEYARSGRMWVTEPNITKLVEPEPEGFKAGDRFTYTGEPRNDALQDTIRTGATGTLDHRDGGTRWIVTFDEGENHIGDARYRSGCMYVREANITKLVEPEPEGFKAGDRFTYTADPCLDFLRGTIRTGVTGTLAHKHDSDSYGNRWYATFDEGENYIGDAEDRIASVWVTESNIAKLVEPAAEPGTTRVVIDALEVALAERDKAVADLAAFKAQVVSVAREYAEDNGWCSTVDEALSDLGLETESTTRVRATIILELDVKHSAVRPIDEDVEEAVEALAIPGFDSVDDWRTA